MIKKYLLGIDIGTTNSKGVITDFEGNIQRSATISHQTDIIDNVRYEQDAVKVWWEDFCRICNILLEDKGINPLEITAVGCSGLGPAFVPVDSTGQPLRQAILYGIDARSRNEIDLLDSLFGKKEVFKISGQILSTQSVGPKFLWYKNNEPKLYTKTKKVLSCNGFLVSKLTDKYVIDINNAAFWAPFFDIHTKSWQVSKIKTAGLDPSILPAISLPGDIAGTITNKAASETGLACGTSVVVGTIDTFAEATGSGAVKDGEIFLVYGTTMTLVSISSYQNNHIDLWPNFHTVPGLYTLLGGMASSGSLIKWFVQNYMSDYLYSDQSLSPDVFPVLEGMAAQVPAGSEGLLVLPYFSGERTPINDEQARGIIAGLTLSHSKNHIYRALLEGTAYAVAHHIELMEDMGIKPKKIIAAGGGVDNRIWTQIVSDVTGLNQICIGENGFSAPMGDAFLAGYGSGIFNNFKPLKSNWIQSSLKVYSDPSLFKIYRQYFAQYKKLYKSSINEIHAIASMGKQ